MCFDTLELNTLCCCRSALGRLSLEALIHFDVFFSGAKLTYTCNPFNFNKTSVSKAPTRQIIESNINQTHTHSREMIIDCRKSKRKKPIKAGEEKRPRFSSHKLQHLKSHRWKKNAFLSSLGKVLAQSFSPSAENQEERQHFAMKSWGRNSLRVLRAFDGIPDRDAWNVICFLHRRNVKVVSGLVRLNNTLVVETLFNYHTCSKL